MTLFPAIRPERLVQDLAAKMTSASLEWHGSNTEWTRQLKDSLRAILQTEGTNVTKVFYSHAERDNHEFLLDIVAWDHSNGEGVTVAVECEWSQHTDAIEEDFWKLLVIKSPIKVMIFALNAKPRKHTQDAVWARLCECLLKFRDHRKGERYVFMDYAPGPARKAWWIEIPSDGRLQVIPERRWIELESPLTPPMASMA